MKSLYCTAVGLFGSAVAYLFGGWSAALTTLLVFMIIDYITGFLLAAVFHKSKKTKTGNLESRVGWKGLIKKFSTLLIVIVANLLDSQLGTSYIKDAVCIAFMSNELISIIENVGLMGIPIPKAIRNAIEILKNNGDRE